MSSFGSAIPVLMVANSCAVTAINTTGYTQLSASLQHTTNVAEIYNTTTKILKIAIGPAGSEVDQIIIPPAGNARIGLLLSKGCRLSASAIDANATTGYLLINLYR